MTIEEIRATVRESDPNLDETDEAFDAAVLLLSLFEVKRWDARSLAKFTGVDVERVKFFLDNLKASRVIRGHTLHHSGWDDEEAGGIAFWLDVSVATGMVARSPQ